MTAPVNDNFADAAPITFRNGLYISDPINNADATREDNGTPEPLSGYTYRTCWWRITPENDTEIQLDTELTTGTAPDTTLQVLTGAGITTLTEVGYNDDIDYGAGNYRSRIDALWLTAGTTYHIVVGQYVGQSDPLDYRLRVRVLTATKTIRPFEIVTVDAPEYDATSSPVTVGSDPWSDEDDGTYVDFYAEGTPNSPNRPIETRQDTVRARFEPARITGLQSATLQVRGYSTTTASFRGEVDAMYDFLDANGAVGLHFAGAIDQGTAPVEWSFPITTGDFDGTPSPPITVTLGFSLQDFEDRLNAGIGVKVWFDLFVPAGESMRIHEYRIKLTYAYDVTTSHAPPLRQYPRSDGLGTSSARRLWPPPRSVQRSNRRAGGYR